MGEQKRKLEAKQKAFEEAPEDFIHKSDILVGMIKEDEGVCPIFSTKISRMFLINALYDIAHQGEMYIRHMDNEIAKKNQSNIITPGDNGKSINRFA